MGKIYKKSENILTNHYNGVTINSTKEKSTLKNPGGYSNEIVNLKSKEREVI